MPDARCWMLDKDAVDFKETDEGNYPRKIFHFPYEIYHLSLIVEALHIDK
jgi:hypothetical protein